MQAFQHTRGAKPVFSYQNLCIVFFLIAFFAQGSQIIYSPIRETKQSNHDQQPNGLQVAKTYPAHSSWEEMATAPITAHDFIHEDLPERPTAFFPQKYKSPKREYLAISIFKETHYRTSLLQYFRPEFQSVCIDTMTESLLKKLELASAHKKEISFLALFSHGSPNTIWGSGGIIIQTPDLDAFGAAVRSGRIRFSKDAVIYLGGCNAGTEHKGNCFAQQLADETGVPVYALVDDSVRPTNETLWGDEIYPKMTYGPQHKPDSEFSIFTPNTAPRSIGSSLDILQLFDRTRMMQDRRDWEREKTTYQKGCVGCLNKGQLPVTAALFEL